MKVTRKEILSEGLELIVSLSEGDGTIKTSATSGTVTIEKVVKGGANTVIVNAAALSAKDSSTWVYEWEPTSAQAKPGRYIVKFELAEPGDTIRVYDEIEILSSTKNRIYLEALPLDTRPDAGGHSVSSNWDNTIRPGTVNLGTSS